jgi:hypothetical protein
MAGAILAVVCVFACGFYVYAFMQFRTERNRRRSPAQMVIDAESRRRRVIALEPPEMATGFQNARGVPKGGRVVALRSGAVPDLRRKRSS